MKSPYRTPADALDQSSMQRRWSNGIGLGLHKDSYEDLVGTNVWVFNGRSIKRTPNTERRTLDHIKSIAGVPRKPRPTVADDHVRIGPPVSDTRWRAAAASEAQQAEEPRVPRRFRIETRDLEHVGYTPGCAGCYAARHRRPHNMHTEHCRREVRRSMLANPKRARTVQAAKQRAEERLETSLLGAPQSHVSQSAQPPAGKNAPPAHSDVRI